MSQDGKRDAAARQKRVRRLKHLIIGTFLTLVFVPILCSVVLLFKVHDLNKQLDELNERVILLEQRGLANQADGVQEVSRSDANDGSVTSQNYEVTDSRRKVYLTFDDGPSANTDRILDILAEYDVKATFFVVGKEDESSKAAILRIVEEGHTLGMHSYSHKYADIYASEENFRLDFEKQKEYLETLTGEKCRFYRFPGGSSNTVSKVDMKLFADYLDGQDVVFHDWNIASGDGGRALLGVETLVRNSTSGIENWDVAVILLHDSTDKGTTVDALPEIIETIQAMENTVILPITEESEPVQHIKREK